MANNLRKFSTEAEYSSTTLSYPAVSWVVSGDTVHYDKEEPSANDKIMMSQEYLTDNGDGFKFANCEVVTKEEITSATLNNVDVITEVSSYCDAATSGVGVYVAAIGINTTTIGDWFSGELALNAASDVGVFDILIPSQITAINYVPESYTNMVVEATTPPSIALGSSEFYGQGIYVPNDAVDTYKATSPWSYWSSQIFPISQYSGNLPI